MPDAARPKETFQVIPDAKQERILAAATRVFAQKGFDGAEVGQIAREAGVAKGSMYNYFASKEDLFTFVCQDGLERHRRAVYDGLAEDADIYALVDHVFCRGVDFVLKNPDYIRLYLSVAGAGMERFADRFSLLVEKFTADNLKKRLRQDIGRGLVRQDLDVNLAAWLINNQYIMFVVSLVSRHFRIRMKEYLGVTGRLTRQTIDRRLTAVLRLIFDVLRPTPDSGREP
ncbi:MAG: TetR/AcrR family transcriptional regulator [Proteobacteria bacterium]|nr:TetR/AcrR family transcriptional regulator [Pseudomonadota bacterium]